MTGDAEAVWPAEVERRWRLCVGGALGDLRGSMKRGRVLSLANVLRLFEMRWAREERGSEVFGEGVRLGRDYLRDVYTDRQPWRGVRGRMQ